MARPSSGTEPTTRGGDVRSPSAAPGLRPTRTPLASATAAADATASDTSSSSATRLDRQRQRVGLDAGQLEQVVDQPGQPVGLGHELQVVAVDLGRVGHDAVVERLGHGPDAGDRRAQVVAHPRHQLAAAVLEGALAVGHLVDPAARPLQLGGQAPGRPARPAVPAPTATTTSAARSWLDTNIALAATRAPRTTATTGMAATTTGLRTGRAPPARRVGGERHAEAEGDQDHGVVGRQVEGGRRRRRRRAGRRPRRHGRGRRRSLAGRGHRAARQGHAFPPVADAPHGGDAARVATGRARSSPAAGGTWTVTVEVSP